MAEQSLGGPPDPSTPPESLALSRHSRDLLPVIPKTQGNVREILAFWHLNGISSAPSPTQQGGNILLLVTHPDV